MVSAEFVVTGAPGTSALPEIEEALSVRREPSHRERKVWLDTHDWRLFRAGLQLVHQIRSRDGWLVLSDLDGQLVSRTPAGRSTAKAVDLSPGAVGDKVGELIGIRALLPRVGIDSSVDVLAVLDAEEKTTARVVLEEARLAKGGAELGLRARVEPLRGYAKAARKASQALEKIPGFEATGEPVFQAALRAHGLDPRGFRTKPELQFTADTPARDAFADMLRPLAGIMQDNVEGTLKQLDTEFLHDLRIAVRRARAVLKFATGIIDEPVRRHYADELKWLGDATSLSRDLDVYLLGFEDMTEQFARGDDLELFRAQLTEHCKKAHTSLNRVLRSARFADLLEGWERDLCDGKRKAPARSKPVGLVADRLIAKAWKRVEKRGNAITSDSPAEAVHDLRKRCKELRYLLEFFGGLYRTKDVREAVRELKRLQDNLGEFQDAEAQRFTVHDHAGELVTRGAPVATLMTMGRLEQHLEERQSAARAELDERWRRFDRKHNQRLYAGLVRNR